MIFKGCKLTTRKRRGLSSVVGALLFVVLMVATFAVLGVALNSQTDIVSTGRDVADIGLKKQQEKFTLNNIVQLPGESLQVNLTNQGQNPTEIFTMIMTNKTDVGEPTKTFEIPSNTSFLVTRNDNEQTNIVSTLDLKLDIPVTGSEFYDFKVISSLGNIKKLGIECKPSGLCGPSVPTVGSGALQAQMFLDGPNGINTKTSTVVLFVQNQGSSSVFNVTPINDCLAMTIPPPLPSVSTFTPCDLDSPDPFPELLPGSTAIFKWDGIVNAEIDEVFLFSNGGSGFESDLVTAVPDSNIAFDTLTVIDPNDCGGCDSGGEGGETIILIDDLLIKPSIFMVIPSPFGASDKGDDERGIWGINVANPTDKDMEITKVTIVAYPPGGQSQDNVISGVTSNPCHEEDIQPLTGPVGSGYWSCPRDNILVWDGLSDPVLLEANSTKSFMVKVEPSGIKSGGSPANLDALIVQANVWSTFGSFGKAGYQSTMYLEKTSIVNVYLSNSTTSRSTIIGYQNDLQEITSHNFKVVLADMDTNPTTTVNSGARLIINIPREWVFDGFNENPIPGFVDPPTVTVHSDGSTQIIAETDVPVGDGTNDAIGIDFNAISPDVDTPRLYVMYVLADGTVTVDGAPKTIGPLNEVVLNVDP